MKSFLALFLTTFCLAADHHHPNTLSDAEIQAGWTLLFDGHRIDQFRNYRAEGVKEAWQVKDGALTLTKKGGGDLITKKQYGSFELKLDYRISLGGNSGLMYHVAETESTPWKTGPEIQIQDNTKGRDPQKAGWLYQLYRPAEGVDATHPSGEWNTLHILITPEKCVQWMNGTKYVQYIKGSEDWKQRVAQSKFSKFPNFGLQTSGHVCLQDHGDVVSFRNIKIRQIKSQ